MCLNNIQSAPAKRKALFCVLGALQKGLLGGRDEQGVPSSVLLGHKEILLPSIFSGWSRNWSEGGQEGESE